MFLRSLVLTCSIALGLASGAAPASAAAPSATSDVAPAARAGGAAYTLAPSAGPLAGEPVVLRMKGKATPLAARVGKKTLRLDKQGKRWVVTMPASKRPRVVAVQVKTRSGWSKPSRSARYEYVAAPRIASLSEDQGPTTGGTEVVLRGSGLSRVTSVTVSGQRATEVDAASDEELRFVTPPGPEGAAVVRLVSPGGVAQAGYRYVLPEPSEEAELVPVGVTQSPAQVQWVTGGSSDMDVDTGDEPWVVSLAPGAPAPALDEPFFLPPGAAVFPSGLAGIVDDVASQVDGSTRVSVIPAQLTEVMEGLDVTYSGPSGQAPEAGSRRRDGGDSSTTAAVSFGKIRAPNFLCTDRGGETASFRGSINLDFKDVHTTFHFDGGGPFHDPSLFAYVNAKPVISGEVSADAAMTCRLGPAWANAQRKVIPLGTTGVTVSFGPRAYFQINASGTLSFEKHLRIMTGFSTDSRGQLQPIGSSGGDDPVVRASGRLEVQAKAGLEIRLALLDRVGIYGSAQLRAGVVATPDTYPSPRVCVELKGGVEFEVGAFLDVWVTRWDYEAWSHDVPLVTWKGCLESPPAVADDGPVITTARLEDAQDQEDYAARLTTADNRPGRWSLVSGRLPTGLRLDPDNGTISGQPSGGVGDHVFTVGFVDGSARSTRATVRLRVTPSEALGGGDVQVRLRWHSDADLDLHVIDPWGDEVYFGNSVVDSGGELDRDSNAGCGEALDAPVENVTWPRGEAPRGQYHAYVVVYDDCYTDDLSWDLQVSVGGRVVLSDAGYGDSDAYAFSVGSGSRPHGARAPEPTRGDGKPTSAQGSTAP